MMIEDIIVIIEEIGSIRENDIIETDQGHTPMTDSTDLDTNQVDVKIVMGEICKETTEEVIEMIISIEMMTIDSPAVIMMIEVTVMMITITEEEIIENHHEIIENGRRVVVMVEVATALVIEAAIREMRMNTVVNAEVNGIKTTAFTVRC